MIFESPNKVEVVLKNELDDKLFFVAEEEEDVLCMPFLKNALELQSLLTDGIQSHSSYDPIVDFASNQLILTIRVNNDLLWSKERRFQFVPGPVVLCSGQTMVVGPETVRSEVAMSVSTTGEMKDQLLQWSQDIIPNFGFCLLPDVRTDIVFQQPGFYRLDLNLHVTNAMGRFQLMIQVNGATIREENGYCCHDVTNMLIVNELIQVKTIDLLQVRLVVSSGTNTDRPIANNPNNRLTLVKL